VFGSYARAEQDAYSDVDIVVIKDTQERFLDRLATVYEYVCPDSAMNELVAHRVSSERLRLSSAFDGKRLQLAEEE
jgi:predicted nucleotidyltransferase